MEQQGFITLDFFLLLPSRNGWNLDEFTRTSANTMPMLTLHRSSLKKVSYKNIAKVEKNYFVLCCKVLSIVHFYFRLCLSYCCVFVCDLLCHHGTYMCSGISNPFVCMLATVYITYFNCWLTVCRWGLTVSGQWLFFHLNKYLANSAMDCIVCKTPPLPGGVKLPKIYFSFSEAATISDQQKLPSIHMLPNRNNKPSYQSDWKLASWHRAIKNGSCSSKPTRSSKLLKIIQEAHMKNLCSIVALLICWVCPKRVYRGSRLEVCCSF